ncbi:MAG: dienelactone hydrolase family protein [Chloroflexia bacterium]
MCYDTDARPPDAPGPAGSATAEDLELTTADGTRFAAYAAHPGAPAHAQLLIYPDVRGLHGFYKHLAMRFAEKGVETVVIDYFGRTAGLSPRDDSFEFMPHVSQLTFPNIISDARAALDYLHQNASLPTFTLGFCMGGTLSILTGTQDLPLSGVIAFYSGMSRRFEGSEGLLLEVAHKVRVPVLGLYGGADQGIPESDVHKLDEELDKAGVEHDIVIYPGAPHSFFDRKAVDFAQESADSWQRVLAFIESHSKQP